MDSLSSALRKAVRAYGVERLEFELRLGHASTSGFRPGIDAAHWEALKKALDSSTCWESTSEIVTLERTASSGMGAHKGTSKFVEQHRPPGPSFWIHKKRLHDLRVALPDVTDSPWDVRASISLEDVEHKQRCDEALDFQRHKHRFSYVHKCWRLDLTRVASNVALDADELTYEVEIELVKPDVLFSRPLDNVVLWGLWLARDMLRLAQTRPAAEDPAPGC